VYYFLLTYSTVYTYHIQKDSLVQSDCDEDCVDVCSFPIKPGEMTWFSGHFWEVGPNQVFQNLYYFNFCGTM